MTENKAWQGAVVAQGTQPPPPLPPHSWSHSPWGRAALPGPCSLVCPLINISPAGQVGAEGGWKPRQAQQEASQFLPGDMASHIHWWT